MVWKYVQLTLFLYSVVCAAAPKPGENPYYGKDFFSSGAHDEPLKEQLFAILNNPHTRISGDYDKISDRCENAKGCFRHTALGYDRARQFILGEFYLVQEKSGYGVKDVYCERIAYANEFRGTKPGPRVIPDSRTVNTEHSWPQSLFTRAFASELQKSDLHHLFPTDSELNSVRSSLAFGDIKSELRRLKCPASKLGVSKISRETVFQPPLSHRGNVARAIFYFSVRYKLSVGREQEEALREWNRLDPVNAEERTRNEQIFQLQNNRNPFVDYPELADRIRVF